MNSRDGTMAEEPVELQELRRTLLRLPGVLEIGIQPTSLVGLDVSLLSMSEMADLPSAALRRTAGGLPGESVVQVWIKMAKRPESWTTLEFLAWFVRDSSRSGGVAQMRVRGLPPRVADHVQVGETLLFVIEWFVVHPDGDLASLLSRVREETGSLALFMNLYADLIGLNEGRAV
ncbi:MAG: hypothetical protein AB7N24_23565 [Dehalococcoidia bacterium]